MRPFFNIHTFRLKWPSGLKQIWPYLNSFSLIPHEKARTLARLGRTDVCSLLNHFPTARDQSSHVLSSTSPTFSPDQSPIHGYGSIDHYQVPSPIVQQQHHFSYFFVWTTFNSCLLDSTLPWGSRGWLEECNWKSKTQHHSCPPHWWLHLTRTHQLDSLIFRPSRSCHSGRLSVHQSAFNHQFVVRHNL